MSSSVSEESKASEASTPLLALRLVTLSVLVAAVTMHMRSLRVFRWEQSVSGGVLITFCFTELGLALCAGTASCGGRALQAYLNCAGAALLAVNAAVIYHHWKRAGQLTQVVAELLTAMGVPLQRQVMIKVILSAASAIGMILDLAVAPFLFAQKK